MTNTPEHTVAAEAVRAADEFEDIRQLAGMMQGLTVTLIQHAARGDAPDFARTAELLLPLHVQFAQVYRTWMARRVTGAMFTLGGDSERRST